MAFKRIKTASQRKKQKEEGDLDGLADLVTTQKNLYIKRIHLDHWLIGIKLIILKKS